MPAITRNAHGDGVGWYVSTRLDADGLATLMRAVYADAGVVPPGHPEGVEVVVRRGAHADYTVAINHGGQMAALPAIGVDLLTGATSSAPWNWRVAASPSSGLRATPREVVADRSVSPRRPRRTAQPAGIQITRSSTRRDRPVATSGNRS